MWSSVPSSLVCWPLHSSSSFPNFHPRVSWLLYIHPSAFFQIASGAISKYQGLDMEVTLGGTIRTSANICECAAVSTSNHSHHQKAILISMGGRIGGRAHCAGCCFTSCRGQWKTSPFESDYLQSYPLPGPPSCISVLNRERIV
jgi:hypothetical protein